MKIPLSVLRMVKCAVIEGYNNKEVQQRFDLSPRTYAAEMADEVLVSNGICSSYPNTMLFKLVDRWMPRNEKLTSL